MHEQIDHYANELVDEFIMCLKSKNVTSLAEYYINWDQVGSIHHKLFPKYRRKFRNYVGS